MSVRFPVSEPRKKMREADPTKNPRDARKKRPPRLAGGLFPGSQPTRAPRETLEVNMNIDDDDEEVIGPTIWEAAAEEEIQENFWCVARQPSTRDLVTSERTIRAPRTSDLPKRIKRANRPHPAPSTIAGSITAARTATRARVTPFTTTSRTCPCATACPSAGRVAGTQPGCGQRRSEGAAHGTKGSRPGRRVHWICQT